MAGETSEYFNRIYEQNEDPWDYESSPYEAEKYQASLLSLPRDVYENAFEIGCSIGVFTAKLAPRCRHLLSVDQNSIALARAKERCRRFSHVKFDLMSLPREYPSGVFDLTILSEVGYYLQPVDLVNLSNQITGHAATLGHLLLVHWLPCLPDFPLRGDDVHESFLNRSEWNSLRAIRTELYRIDVLERQHGLA